VLNVFENGSGMSLINENSVESLAHEIHAVREAAHQDIHEKITRSRKRLGGTSRTSKSAATRERIMDVAATIISERHTTNFQMSEISERCQMSKGAVYYYFADRTQLVDAVFDASLEQLLDDVRTVAAESKSARDALSSICEKVVGLLNTDGVLPLAMSREISNPQAAASEEEKTRFSHLISIVAAQIERGKADGLVRADVESTQCAIYVMGGLLVSALVSVIWPDFYPSDRPVDVGVMDLVVKGAGTELASAIDVG